MDSRDKVFPLKNIIPELTENAFFKLEEDMALPRHIAIIMDGNGRWAAQQGLSRSEGHLAGAKTVEVVIKECLRHKIPHLSLYAFSTENWNRPQEEVKYLFELFCQFVKSELPLMLEKGIRFSMIGDKAKLPQSAQTALEQAISETKDGKNLELTLAINYSGTQEILHAVRQSVTEILSQKTQKEHIQTLINTKKSSEEILGYLTSLFDATHYTEQNLRSHFYLPNLPDPDLIIRTSGELRLSNFYLLQAAYAEFYFTETLWPDFSAQDFEKALLAFQNRKRRFGKTDEQLNEKIDEPIDQ